MHQSRTRNSQKPADVKKRGTGDLDQGSSVIVRTSGVPCKTWCAHDKKSKKSRKDMSTR